MKKDPSKLCQFDQYDFTGKVQNVISELQKIVDQHPNAHISFEFDHSGCYYEGDLPGLVFTVRSKQPSS
jgi:hypothetical protein